MPDLRRSNADDLSALSLLLAALPDDERALCVSWHPRRQATFAAGRHALREALVAAGIVGSVDVVGVIGRDDRGAPVLPPLPVTVRVSVTHKDSVAAAIVDRRVLIPRGLADDDSDLDCAVGIDLELDDGRERASTDKLARQVLLDDEMRALDDDDATRRRQLFQRFSLKEALYKALDPFVRRYVGFLEVGVVVDAGRARFSLPAEDADDFVADGAVIDSGLDGVVLTMARVRQLRVR